LERYYEEAAVSKNDQKSGGPWGLGSHYSVPASFIDVGIGLTTIREKRLYREEFKTFKDYCKERWGMSRAHAKQADKRVPGGGQFGAARHLMHSL